MNMKYNFIQRIGEGMFGTVDLVKDSKGRKFALKTVKVNPFSIEQNFKEVDATKLITHPNLIKIYDFKLNQQFLEIRMEYCGKGNLQGLISSNQVKGDFQKCLNIFSQIVDAGVALNRKGVIHRDIKPENIMISENQKGTVMKLGDFGCATVQRQNSDTIMNSSFQKGTAVCSSPQLLENKEYTAKCDIWSVGCLLYQIYFGVHPFVDESIEKVKQKIKKFTNQFQLQKGTNPTIKYFLKLTLQYQERDRASWKQIYYNLLIFNSNKDLKAVLQYLNQLSTIANLIYKQIWKNRKDSQLNKETHKAFAFYMNGFEYTLHKLIIEIISESQEFNGIFTEQLSKQRNTYNKILQKAKKNQQITKQVYNKIYGHLSKNGKSKLLIAKIPMERIATFSYLEYSIRYGKKLLEQVINSGDPQIKVKQNRGYKLLSKWVNFPKWFSIDKNPQLKDLQKQSVDKITLTWIKEQLSSGLT